MNINWKQKLSSRKFWAALVGFISAILVACNFSELSVQQITAVITAGGVLIAYILGESYVDANRGKPGQSEEEHDGTSL